MKGQRIVEVEMICGGGPGLSGRSVTGRGLGRRLNAHSRATLEYVGAGDGLVVAVAETRYLFLRIALSLFLLDFTETYLYHRFCRGTPLLSQRSEQIESIAWKRRRHPHLPPTVSRQHHRHPSCLCPPFLSIATSPLPLSFLTSCCSTTRASHRDYSFSLVRPFCAGWPLA